MAATSTKVNSEDILGQKWDKCVVDAGIKMSSGLAIGKSLKKVLVKSQKCQKWNFDEEEKTFGNFDLNHFCLLQELFCRWYYSNEKRGRWYLVPDLDLAWLIPIVSNS